MIRIEIMDTQRRGGNPEPESDTCGVPKVKRFGNNSTLRVNKGVIVGCGISVSESVGREGYG